MTKKQNTPAAADDLRAALLSRVAKPEPVEVPGVGVVYVKRPSWLDASSVPSPEAAAASGLSADQIAKAWALAVVLCDADGRALFDGTNPEHLRAVAALDRDTTEPLVRAANKAYGGDEKNV